MKFWQVDAFTNTIFTGNPAAVFTFDKEPATELMQKIAREMNLSETAFVIKEKGWKIRWFTPKSEVNLCGHATLAAAHILFQQKIIEGSSVCFQSRSGPLTVTHNENSYTLDFPLQKAFKIDPPKWIKDLSPEFVGSNGEDCMVVVDDDNQVRNFSPNHEFICLLPERGFLLTAKDKTGEFDYIYRAFFPKLNVPEDPVTGSANTCLAAYWSKNLQKPKLKVAQVSERGGHLEVEVLQERVLITGNAITVFEGNLFI